MENETFELVEQAFREPGDTGIQSLLSDMWSGWGDVANQPQDEAARGQVLKRLETLVGGIHFSQASLGAQWTQSRESLDVLVADVNASAASIADLNKAIQRANQSGLTANDLSDQRDLLVMKLADQVGATVRHGDDGVVDVLVGGMTLVSGSTAASLATAGTYSVDGVTADPPRIVTGTGGYTVRAGGDRRGPAQLAEHDHPELPQGPGRHRGQPGDQPQHRARCRLRPERRRGDAAAGHRRRPDHRGLAQGHDHRPEEDRRLQRGADRRCARTRPRQRRRDRPAPAVHHRAPTRATAR